MVDDSRKHYLFIAGNHVVNDETMAAPVVIRELLERGYWVVEGNARRPSPVTVGAKAVFYAAGGHGVFMASAIIAGSWSEHDERHNPGILGELNYSFASPLIVPAQNTMWFGRHVKARLLLEDLSFTRRMPRWGVYFRSSARQITAADFKLIVSKGSPVSLRRAK